MRAERLSDADVQKHLQTVKGWTLVNGKLHKSFECKDFVTAFGKMTQVALVSEWMNHHPEWCNVWNKVVIDLNTHSVQGISNLDFQLAEKIRVERLASQVVLGAECPHQGSAQKAASSDPSRSGLSTGFRGS